MCIYTFSSDYGAIRAWFPLSPAFAVSTQRQTDGEKEFCFLVVWNLKSCAWDPWTTLLVIISLMLWIIPSFQHIYWKVSIYLFERVMRERERESEIFCLLFHSLYGGNCQGWPKPKAGVRIFVQVSHVGGRAQPLGESSIAFPRLLAGR